MSEDQFQIKNGKQLYEYQQRAIEDIFSRLKDHDARYNLLYQLPTGGGKTVIFSEIARRFIQNTGKKVLILTHRIELCGQTSLMLDEFGVNNKVINSAVKEMPVPNDYMCFVAMVETLNNRLRDKILNLDNIGLMIVDEAHYNSFGKLFRFYEKGVLLGVTATPLSSNINIRMRDNYDELIVGESITSLIETGFLARATTYHYHVGLTSLKVGRNGDYTVSSSERLYNNHAMQDKLLSAYKEKCIGKKTLIFNNGIATSQYVYATFQDAGYEIKHLDHTHTGKERREILDWFREKPDAILTSVSILTTGFDEPTVECIILNRATKSLTLYFQMIGRGSRILPNKKEFSVIDLGNNLNRFGLWDAPVDWAGIFKNPELYLADIRSDEDIERNYRYEMPEELREKFGKSQQIDFDVKQEHQLALSKHQRPKVVIERSIEQHIQICLENSADIDEALVLADLLKEEIEFRVRVYSRCLSKTSESYVKWLQDDYKRKLKFTLIRKSHEFPDAPTIGQTGTNDLSDAEATESEESE
ncbi:MAG TPA: DEAD/DEAH box helicase [Bacteroidia bacterium]|nr:DEAD/DEAH box helicase [Bacteroidia bacterium]HNS11908.1 DEAD/DEAH box helicase [Bacteroidia bacterium]